MWPGAAESLSSPRSGRNSKLQIVSVVVVIVVIVVVTVGVVVVSTKALNWFKLS